MASTLPHSLPSPSPPCAERVDARRQARRRVRGDGVGRTRRSFPATDCGRNQNVIIPDSAGYEIRARDKSKSRRLSSVTVPRCWLPSASTIKTLLNTRQNPRSIGPDRNLASKLHACQTTRAKQFARSMISASVALARRVSRQRSRFCFGTSLTHPPHPSAIRRPPSHHQAGGGKRGDVRHLSVPSHTIIITGFSISILNAPISSAPSAPSTAR